MVSFVFAVIGLLLSAITHCSTFLGIDPIEKVPPLFVLHIGIFALLGVLILEHKLMSIAIIEKRVIQADHKNPLDDQDLTYAPLWMKTMLAFSFVYAIINFAIFFFLCHDCPPSERNGQYFLKSGQEITQNEFHRYQAYEARGFSGHWMIFYSGLMCLSYSASRKHQQAYSNATEPLLKILVDPNETMNEREQAIVALKKVGDFRTIASLLDVLEHEKSNMHQSIKVTLAILLRKIRLVYFGQHQSHLEQYHALRNPEVASLIIPMSHLRTIVIDVSSCDVAQVERFITYAVNYIGQKHLKRHVKAQIYGKPEQLPPNIRNTLLNLCQDVSIHKMTLSFEDDPMS